MQGVCDCHGLDKKCCDSAPLSLRFVTRNGIITSSMWSFLWWRCMWTEWPMTPTWWQMTGPSTPHRSTCNWQSVPAGKVRCFGFQFKSTECCNWPIRFEHYIEPYNKMVVKIGSFQFSFHYSSFRGQLIKSKTVKTPQLKDYFELR